MHVTKDIMSRIESMTLHSFWHNQVLPLSVVDLVVEITEEEEEEQDFIEEEVEEEEVEEEVVEEEEGESGTLIVTVG